MDTTREKMMYQTLKVHSIVDTDGVHCICGWVPGHGEETATDHANTYGSVDLATTKGRFRA